MTPAPNFLIFFFIEKIEDAKNVMAVTKNFIKACNVCFSCVNIKTNFRMSEMDILRKNYVARRRKLIF